MTTAQSIVDQARQRADMVGSLFVTDDEAFGYVKLGWATLYDIITQSSQNYFINTYNITLVNNQQDYALPADFYKMVGVDLTSGVGNPVTLRPFNWVERNRYKYSGLMTIAGPMYRYNLLGVNIRFTPVPGTGTIKVYYTPEVVQPALISSEIDMVGFGFQEYLILYCAMKMLAKEESDTTLIVQELAAQQKRVESMTADQDRTFPKTVVDVDTINDNLYLQTYIR
jgi:hypothetical protein